MSTPAPQTSNAVADAREPHPLVELFKIAGPTVATMTSYTIMQFVDKLMVSRIGPDPVYVGAQGNGGLAAFVPISIVMGIMTVINTYVSQNLGAGRPERAPAYAWNGLWIALCGWLLLIVYGLLVPDLFAAMGHEGERLALETTYGQILVFGSILTMATRCVSQFFFGMHKPLIVMVAGIAGNVTNLFLNWVLIYGNLGAPPLGVAGAAIATLIGTAVELSIPLAVFLGPAMNRLYGTRAAWRPSRSHIRELLRLGWPAGAMFGNEMICWSVFMIALVGRFGPHHSTAGWIAHQYMSLSFMPAVGLSVAVTATVGKCMGRGRPDLAAKRAWLGVGVALAYMGLCAICFVIFREPLARLFIEKGTPPEVSRELIRMASAFLIATAAFQLFDAVAMILSGALRGAGDTVVVGVFTVGLSWVVIVGGGLAFVNFAPSLGSLGPWIAAAIYIFLLAMVILLRFASGKWKSIKLVDRHEPVTTNPAFSQPAVTTDGVA